MNNIEKKAKNLLEKDGWKVIHKGCPDFLLLKYDKFGNISDVQFAEVKSFNIKNGVAQVLTRTQKIWKKAFEYLNVKYRLIQIDIDLKDESNKLMCKMCGELFTYCGRGRPPKYCKECAKSKKKQYDRHYRKKMRSFYHKDVGQNWYDKFWNDNEYKKVETRKKLRLNLRKCPNCGKKSLYYDDEDDIICCSECGVNVE
jgi:hypothetical protein